MAENLTRHGMLMSHATDDGLIIEGGHALHGAVHRHPSRITALPCPSPWLPWQLTEKPRSRDADCVNISYPEFYEDLRRLTR